MLLEKFYRDPEMRLGNKRLEAFVRDRLGELRELLGTSVDDDIRIAIWIFDADDETNKATFGPTERLIGTAFDEPRIWNEPNAAMLPSIMKIAYHEAYSAVLSVPVRFGETKLGRLTVDRKKARSSYQKRSRLPKNGRTLSAFRWKSIIGR